ncbi:hypothetical protein [uncultured Cedecea sp.]|nr:hypothetical protein [uncultured Cedecea sp.]
MKKVDFRLLPHASSARRKVELAFKNQQGDESVNIELSIITPLQGM